MDIQTLIKEKQRMEEAVQAKRAQTSGGEVVGDPDDHFQAIYAISKEIKGLGCRDFFFFKPFEADSRLVNAYQDHLNTIQTFLKGLEGVDLTIKKQVQPDLLSTLKVVMREIKEKIIAPVRKAVKGDDEMKTFTGYAARWNDRVSDVKKLNAAMGTANEDSEALGINTL